MSDAEYYQETVEMPFDGHAPTPDLKAQLQERFLVHAHTANPNGLQGNPEVVSTCLVTGQSFAMTFKIGVITRGEESNTEGDSEDRPKQLPKSAEAEGSTERR